MPNEVVEYLRNRMVCLAKERGSLTHPDVVSVSQRLDRYILQAQMQKTVSRSTLCHIDFTEEQLESPETLHLEKHYRMVNV